MNFPTPLTIYTSPKILIYKNAVSQNISKNIIGKYAHNLNKSALQMAQIFLAQNLELALLLF